jgi:carbamoyl-phosphate synthase large subunit
MDQIVILSAGRRVALVQCFKEAAHHYGLEIIAADANPAMSSACHIADKAITLPHVLSENYTDELLQYCRNHDVKMIVPTIDTELSKLGDLREQLEQIGVHAIVSDRPLIDACHDKRLTRDFFRPFGLQSPAIYPLDAINFPAIVKPFDGSLSTGIAVLRTINDLTPAMKANPRNIFCQYLESNEFEEFTCDAYFSAAGRLCCIVPRLRIEVRGGEVAKGRTENNQIVPFIFEKLNHLEGARGCLTIQIMKHRDTHEMFLIEVNPRFGGGYPLTARSGAEYHKWLIEEYILNHEPRIFHSWTDGLLMLRYDDAVFKMNH